MPDNDPSSNTVSEVTKKAGAFQISSEPIAGADETEAHKFEIGSATEAGGASESPVFEDLGELPASYQEDTLFLVARDPRWVFTYWDFDWIKYPANAFRGGVKQFF